MTSKRLGFFTWLLDEATAQQRYRLAAEQIVHAEANGFDSAWVAQHHFHEAEGGLPSPFPLVWEFPEILMRNSYLHPASDVSKP